MIPWSPFDGLRRLCIPELGQRGGEVAVRLALEAEQVLDAGACGRDAHAPVLRRDLHAVQEIGTTLGELTDGGEAPGPSQQQSEALFARRRLRQQPDRGHQGLRRASQPW